MSKKWWQEIILLMILWLPFHALGDSLTAQRERYQAIKQAWDANDNQRIASLMPTLTEYPLYPYLEYRRLTQDLNTISIAQVNDFIKQYPYFPLNQKLSTLFVNQLAKRSEWHSLLAFSPTPPRPVIARCNYYYAKWQIGNKQAAWQGAKQIWLHGYSLPKACDQLFTLWQQAGQLTTELILQRIFLAIKNNDTALITSLVNRLPAKDQIIGQRLAKLQQDPSLVVEFASKVKPSEFNRQVILVIFSRFARQSVEKAKLAIPMITQAQKMNHIQRQQLKEDIAWQLFGDVTVPQAKWRDDVIQHSSSISLRERRVRIALASNDMHSLAQWLKRLPKESRNKEEWQYWQAIALIAQGKHNQGKKILFNLVKRRGFYSMVAAQKLNIPYPINIALATKPEEDIDSLPEVQRIGELLFWQKENLARTEWINLLIRQKKNRQQQLARYAFEHRWADLSVQATIIAKLWDHLTERFPIAWEQEFERYTKDKKIDKSFAMAIARQESGWNPQVRSAAGAIGLMQLMPQTAQQVAKSKGIVDYTDSSKLIDPAKNIELGTAYLETVFEQFSFNRVLACAAYNAGPARVTRWLAVSDGKLNAIAFIETIPFSETRRYVKNVLVYNLFYQHFLGKTVKLLTEGEWLMNY
ncbi:murein transglycosylase [Arsenophonus sp. aPb]|uniref:murein transglycosylase n=1 Tax=Arsenophonus sp. aPb TaxID=3041619 RepID=UPI002469758F|nr:murein transglycosylase [Arsenophonus sp. aPb]WGL97837.1 murein transglycosylase [Arsenophonus sp. aPb]